MIAVHRPWLAIPPELSSGLADPTTELGPTPASSEGFGATLARSLDAAEAVAQDADTQAEGMVTGEVDIHEAMIAMEKADLVLKLGATVRNKLLDAYRQLSQG